MIVLVGLLGLLVLLPGISLGHSEHHDHHSELSKHDWIQSDGLIVSEDDPQHVMHLTDMLQAIELHEGLNIAFYLVYLPLIGLVLWGVMLRGQTEEQARRLKAWLIQLQRLLFLIVLGSMAELVYRTVGFQDVQGIRMVLLETTTGVSWSALLILSLLGMFFLQRLKFFDVTWLLAAVLFRTQIGHAADVEERITASIMSGLHLLAASLWIGGLLLILMLWGRHRYEAERLLPSFTGASLTAVVVLAVSGLASSTLYLPDLSYLVETRWGLLLIGKLAVLLLVILLAPLLRRRIRRNAVYRVGGLLKLDLLLILVISAMSALMTNSNPIPSSEPIHWHVMGEDIHMTLEVTPKALGDNRMGVTIWLPEGDEPRQVELRKAHLDDADNETIIPLTLVPDASDMAFIGFSMYTYQADGERITEPGRWRFTVEVIDAKGKKWEYQKISKVY